mmetsp:Transcript_4687/g.5024  ORF Transcript_4687/g.5024 Transcript_4687/m.5024 type:complete len:92 (-) Transcript_4687:31-306(-)
MHDSKKQNDDINDEWGIFCLACSMKMQIIITYTIVYHHCRRHSNRMYSIIRMLEMQLWLLVSIGKSEEHAHVHIPVHVHEEKDLIVQLLQA